MIMLAESGIKPQVAEVVRVTDVTQELSVGVGQALASVRTLSNVSLAVRERELVVLSGSRGAGERALLAVIAGDRRGVTGNCDIAPHTRIRLMRIAAAAALALTEEWDRAEQFSPEGRGNLENHEAPVTRERELFLLDVAGESESTTMPSNSKWQPREWNECNRGALFAWATTCRNRGGAVVMAAGALLGDALIKDAVHQLQPHWMARRPTVARFVRERRNVRESSVRVIAMHSGRLAPPVRLSLHSSERF
ncbi:MAG: hypothetical protein ABJC26_02720 [Gemmatimonadaceae bacterium]